MNEKKNLKTMLEINRKKYCYGETISNDIAIKHGIETLKKRFQMKKLK